MCIRELARAFRAQCECAAIRNRCPNKSQRACAPCSLRRTEQIISFLFLRFHIYIIWRSISQNARPAGVLMVSRNLSNQHEVHAEYMYIYRVMVALNARAV